MLTLAFKNKKEKLLGAQGQVGLPLLGITGKYLKTFYPLIANTKSEKLPEVTDILKAYSDFVNSILNNCDESSASQTESSLYQEISKQTDPALLNFSPDLDRFKLTESDIALELNSMELEPSNVINHSITIINKIMKNINAASLWLEFLALLCAVYFWLAPKYEKVIGGKKVRKKPEDLFIQLITSKGKDYFEDTTPAKIFYKIFDAFDAIKNHFGDDYFGKKVAFLCTGATYETVWPFDPPLLWELVARIFLYRINNVNIDLAQQRKPLPSHYKGQIPYKQLLIMENPHILGIGFRAELLLQLAWIEIFYFLINNNHANVCYFCGNIFLYKKAYNKKICSSNECKQAYQKEENKRKRLEGIKIYKGEGPTCEIKEYNRRMRKQTEFRKKQAKKLYNEGKTIREIAEQSIKGKNYSSIKDKNQLEQAIKKEEAKIERWVKS